MQKNKKSDRFFAGRSIAPAAAGAFYKRINRRLTQVQEMQNATNIYRVNA